MTLSPTVQSDTFESMGNTAPGTAVFFLIK